MGWLFLLMLLCSVTPCLYNAILISSVAKLCSCFLITPEIGAFSSDLYLAANYGQQTASLCVRESSYSSANGQSVYSTDPDNKVTRLL